MCVDLGKPDIAKEKLKVHKFTDGGGGEGGFGGTSVFSVKNTVTSYCFHTPQRHFFSWHFYIFRMQESSKQDLLLKNKISEINFKK